ncbi:MAG: AAA family ATPase, partial [Minisyncoccia bacterium]
MRQDEALEIVKTGVNVFLTGGPGSGKTHTVNTYVAWLRAHDIEPALTASTGIAATHIGGMTVHAWSGIGIRESLTAHDLDEITSKEHVVRRIQKAPVLIIDEVSMLSGETLSMVERVAREARRNDRPFGGMQVVLVGDFFQLPPVGGRGRNPSFAFESSAW